MPPWNNNRLPSFSLFLPHTEGMAVFPPHKTVVIPGSSSTATPVGQSAYQAVAPGAQTLPL